MRINKAISIITALLVFLVALGAFALSYSALREVALTNGIGDRLSYIWPLLVDFSLIVFSLSVVNAYLQTESTWKQWALVGIYTLATIGFNILHAPDNLQAQIVAAIAPVSLFFSFELLMSQLRITVKKHGITLSVTQLEQMVSHKRAEVSQLDTILAQKSELVSSLTMQLDELKAVSNGQMTPANDTILAQANDAKQSQIEQRREQVLNLLQAGKSQGDIANELKVSLATVKRDTKALNGQVTK